MGGEEKRRRMREALKQVFERPVVVSGPLGSGKTHCLREACRDLGLELVEIDRVEEYKERRLSSALVYLFRTSEIGEGAGSYRGIVFETESPYLYRKVEGCVHVQVRKPSQKEIMEVFALRKSKLNMHRASILARSSEKVEDRMRREFLGEDPASFYHVVGKILYRKTAGVPEEVFDLLRKAPAKMLMYIHENIPQFMASVKELSEVMQEISGAVGRGEEEARGCLVLSRIWQSKRHAPKRFYSIRSSPFHKTK